MFQTKKIFLAISLISIIGCTNKDDAPSVSFGFWRAELSTQGKKLPFNFKLVERNERIEFQFINGEEIIIADEYQWVNDSLIINMHVFDSQIKVKVSENEMNGFWSKNYVEGYDIPIHAVYGDSERFKEKTSHKTFDFSGKWPVTFVRNGDSTAAIGVFEQANSHVSGTFLKVSGDYRFLQGKAFGDSLKLSTFDGEHAYLFEAKIMEDKTIRGEFWAGKGGHLTWFGEKNESAVLNDGDDLTYLKDGFDRVDFSFTNEKGQLISTTDDEYSNKVLIIQILGSWCPNCLDETKFLSEWYKKNHHRGVEIIGLAFERKAEFEYGASRIIKLKDRLEIDYEILFAGKTGRESTQNALPMLNAIVSYPTTIFIDRDGVVQKIHSGFSGPGTGSYYDEFVSEFNTTIDNLLEE